MIRKLFASLVIGGMLMGALGTTAFAATGEGAAAHPRAKPPTTDAKHRHMNKEAFGGIVVAISDAQLTVRNKQGKSQTFLRTEDTRVFRGRDHRVPWSEIEVGSRVTVRFEDRGGKLFATRIQLGLAGVHGKVESVSGNSITIQTKDGKDLRITVTEKTKFFERHSKGKRSPGSLQDIQPGMHLSASGTRDPNGSFDAAAILFWGEDKR